MRNGSQTTTAKFRLGRPVMTPGVIERWQDAGKEPIVEAGKYLQRHVSGDWGDIDAEDVQANEEALGEALRLFSVYDTPEGFKVWVITEADRSATTILLPSEY